MVKLLKEWALAVLIPMVFLLGIAAYFVLAPNEIRTLSGFIGYISSLSTITMVLVYVFTTSRQLNAIKSQLGEMRFTRTLQSHPLPIFCVEERECFGIEPPRAYVTPPDFSIVLDCHSSLEYQVENVGNGPAICVDIVPTIEYTSEGKKKTVREACLRISSLKQGEKTAEKKFSFTMGKELLKTEVSSEQNPVLKLEILYKNLLGASFAINQEYEVWIYPEEIERSKTWMKAFETMMIDFSEEIKKHDVLRKQGPTKKEAEELFDKIDLELVNRVGREELHMCLNQIPESFSVRILTQQDYAKEMQKVYYPRLIGVFKEESHGMLETARAADKRTVKCGECQRKTLHVYSKKTGKWVCANCGNEMEMVD